MAACQRCLRDATFKATGPYRNGRPAVELLCDRHSGEAREHFGTWRLVYDGFKEREYRLTELHPISPLSV
jgi:hypothetical protein